MFLYEKTKLEHKLSKTVAGEVIVAITEGFESKISVAQICGNGDLKAVAKHYVEEEKQVYILLECAKFDTSLQSAKDLGCGVIFECGTKFDDALKAGSIEIERFAGLNGISQNVKRVASIYANSVPFSISRNQAEEEISKLVLDKDRAVEALDVFGRILQKNQAKAAGKNLISSRPNVTIREFGFQKFSEIGLLALREEMLKAYSAGGVYVWKLPMGIGKTVIINELIALAAKNAERPAYIAPRVNISRGICETVAANYLNECIAGSEHELDALSICVNSITKEKFKVYLKQSGVVILEEVEQMIAHVTEGVCKNRVQVYNEILNLIKNARLVIALDANANDEVIELLSHAYKEVNVLQARSDNSGIEVAFAEDGSVQRELLFAAENKQQCVVMVEFPSQADTVKKIFDDKGLKSLVITAETRDFPEVAAFISNPNKEIQKYNGAIIYNSAMQSSTSIEIDWADHVFGMFKGLLRISDMMQMMRRYRPAIKITVSLDSQVRPMIFNENINKLYNISDTESKEFNAAALRIHRQSVEEHRSIRLNFAIQIQQDGYRISYLEESENDSAAWASFRKAAKEAREVTVARTLQKAHAGVVKSFKKSGSNKCQDHIDRENILEAARNIGINIENLTDLTEDDIKFFTRRRANKVLDNARCWYRDSDFNELANFDDTKAGIDKKNLRKRKEILGGFMAALGINEYGEGVADAQKAASYIKANLQWFEILGLVTAKKINFETRNQQLAAANNTLESIGLSLKRYKASGKHIYKLDKEKYQRMSRFLGVTI